MNKTFFTWKYFYKRTEVYNTCDLTVVSLTHFNFSGDLLNLANSDVCFSTLCCKDFDCTVVFNLNVSIRLFSNLTNHCATFTDNIADLVLIDFNSVNAWSEFTKLFAVTANSFVHYVKNMQTCFFCLFKGNLHDFFGNTFNLNVHLKCSDTTSSTRYFKVHVTKVIFVT